MALETQGIGAGTHPLLAIAVPADPVGGGPPTAAAVPHIAGKPALLEAMASKVVSEASK